MKPTELRTYLYEEANKAMSAAGFNAYPQKALQGCYSYKINEGCIGQVTLGASPHLGSLNINPSIGTRLLEVEDLVDRWLPLLPGESKLDRSIGVTLGQNLGYISSIDKWVTYVTDSTTDIDRALLETMAMLTEFGIPFMQKHSSLESIYAAVIRTTTNRTSKPRCSTNNRSEPILHLLMNENERAYEIIQKEFLTHLAWDTSAVPGIHRSYAEHLLEFIEERKTKSKE
ncbi:MAG: hypothetical protein Q8T09_08910 [Candidatus Melainabacteria bacterium]|nr:hypothetical protein [Candidatus Melainabacteria bacterium]